METRQRILSLRAILVGLLLSVLIVVVTPYNDYVVDGSFIIGSYFPPIIALCMLAIVLLVNGPLHKFAPRLALSPGELAVIMAMALISCSIPSQGLLRQLVPLPVAPSRLAGEYSADYPRVLKDMNLPPSLFVPRPPETGASDPAVTSFYARLPEGEPIPWGRWIQPLATWLIFAGAFITSLVALACLLRFQWTVNERLPFPIVQLQAMLVAPPAPGRALNDVFRSYGFWIAMIAVLVVESSLGLNAYFPNYVPLIPFKFDLTAVLSDEPWSRLSDYLKKQTIFFTLLGVSYFTQTRTSFSLWFCVVAFFLARWLFDPSGSVPDGAYVDQQLGAAFAFAAGVLWIGRAHWLMIFRALVGRNRVDDPQGSFVSYRMAAIIFLLGIGVMLAWLIGFAGCSVGIAVIIVAMCLMAHFVTARVVAETGLAFVRVGIGMNQLITTFSPKLLSTRDAFLYGASHYTLMQSARESTLTFALHGINTIDAADPQPPGERRRGIVALLGATLVIATIACIAASLWCYYRHAIPLSDPAVGVLNQYGTISWPRTFLMEFPVQVDRGLYPSRPQNTWLHLGIGIAVMLVLQVLTMRFAAWPILPVGFLLCSNWYMQLAWFSLLLGWLAKVLILRFGGATLFNNLKPIFIGLIFGEAVATGLWLIITLVLAAGGYDVQIIRFLPQ